jgi:hypothetical protein
VIPLSKIENFKHIFNEVFDENQNITACGRQKCKELIAAANAINDIDVEDDKYYGDIESGRLNIENMKSLYNRIQN